MRSNNTNKLSPQELETMNITQWSSSNNTNKLSPQEPLEMNVDTDLVQIIQINLVLKNSSLNLFVVVSVQIIQINLVLKNSKTKTTQPQTVQIIQINLVLKNIQIH